MMKHLVMVLQHAMKQLQLVGRNKSHSLLIIKDQLYDVTSRINYFKLSGHTHSFSHLLLNKNWPRDVKKRVSFNRHFHRGIFNLRKMSKNFSSSSSLTFTKFFLANLIPKTGNTKGGRKYHCTADLLFDWFGISCMTTDNFCFCLQTDLSKPVQQEVNGTVILPPLVLPA